MTTIQLITAAEIADALASEDWTLWLAGRPMERISGGRNAALKHFRTVEAQAPSYGNRVLKGPAGEVVNVWDLRRAA